MPSSHRRHANGDTPLLSSENLRWLAGLLVAALVAYWTSVSAIKSEMAEMRATQSSQFQEMLRRMDTMQEDVRELRVLRQQQQVVQPQVVPVPVPGR